MTPDILLLPIIIPLIAAALVFAGRGRFTWIRDVAILLATTAVLLLAILLFKTNLIYSKPWGGFGWEFSLRTYHFSAFIMLAASAFAFLVALYSAVFMRGRGHVSQFYAYFLTTLAFVNGAVLSDNLLVMLFFWEGLLLTLFAMIAIGNKAAFRTATKAFIIVGIADLCLMLGIIITAHLAGTLVISKINLPLGTAASAAFIFLMIGAIAKAGCMPFHTWIPDAAIDAPLPFMAFLPAAIEKLVGIYFLTRISMDMFQLRTDSWLSFLLMGIGAATIILAVMMALIQKDYKRLLSYHAISQVGYMILGIGTALPVGIVGGLFHMINNALYKSCLFLTGGAVERETGTTDLSKLGGIGVKMPVTFACFIIAAVSISGVPPFNGFFSKELVYDGALERGLIFYLAAVIGSFFTAASFLKLGHAAFLGRISDANKGAREVSAAMLVPMILIASVCVLFGVYNALPIKVFIQPILGAERLEGRDFSGMPANTVLVVVSIIVLAGAFLNHLYGVKKKGNGLGAVDHIHYAPVLSGIYDKAERRFFDPYNWGRGAAAMVSGMAWRIDRGIDWLYDNFAVGTAYLFSRQIRKAHTGNYATYLAWSLAGTISVVIFLIIN